MLLVFPVSVGNGCFFDNTVVDLVGGLSIASQLLHKSRKLVVTNLFQNVIGNEQDTVVVEEWRSDGAGTTQNDFMSACFRFTGVSEYPRIVSNDMDKANLVPALSE